MISELVQYSKRLNLAGPGFAPKTVRWAIHVAIDGTPGIVSLGDASQKKNPGRTFEVCPEASGMNSGGKSHFLVETLETVLLMCKKEEDRAKFEAKHDFFVKQLHDAAAACSDCSEMTSFADIIEDQEVRATLIAKLKDANAKPTDKITAMFEGRDPAFLVEDTCWHEWWGEYRKALGKTEKKPVKKRPGAKANQSGTGRMRCFVTGEIVKPAMTHPKITELADVGASAMGASLVSFDKDATCSYGLRQSANAAMSEEAAAAYRSGLNHVLANHSRRLAGAKIAYWFKKAVPDKHNVFVEPLLGGSDSQAVEESQKRDALKRAKELLAAISVGEEPDFAKKNHYYAMTLSGNGGRVVVRDWMAGPFEELLESIICWFDNLSIVNLSGQQMVRLPKFETLVTSLLPKRKPDQKYENWIKPIGSYREALWQAALNRKKPIPYSAMVKSLKLLTQYITNNELEEARDDERSGPLEIARMYCRLGILKAFHNRSGDIKMKEDLMKKHPRQEYHCGRLMAVIAELQRVALAKIDGDGRWTSVNAGVVQRYYAAAASTPALAFGRLLRTANYHLGKMEGTEKDYYVKIFKNYITEIQDMIGETSPGQEIDYPQTLNFRQQSLFALGYYHQIAGMNADRAEAKVKRLMDTEKQNT